MDPTPRSLVLDLLSTLGRRSAPVRALVEAGALFEMRENSLRVALARLCADGLVERDGRGAYRLGPAAQPVNREIRGWRQLERRIAEWRGDWYAVRTSALPRGSARDRRQRARALRFLGFRPLTAGLELRPANLAGGIEAVRQRLAALELAAPGLLFLVAEFDAETDATARALWDGAELVRSYRQRREAIERSARQLRDLPRAAAMAESFRLGGAAIRQLVLDPLLPEPIVPAAERRALVEAMIDYDRLGREAWADWLGAAAPGPRQLPVGVRGPRAGADLLSTPEGI